MDNSCGSVDTDEDGRGQEQEKFFWSKHDVIVKRQMSPHQMSINLRLQSIVQRYSFKCHAHFFPFAEIAIISVGPRILIYINARCG